VHPVKQSHAQLCSNYCGMCDDDVRNRQPTEPIAMLFVVCTLRQRPMKKDTSTALDSKQNLSYMMPFDGEALKLGR